MKRLIHESLMGLCLLIVLQYGARGEDSVAILPGEIALTGPHARQALLVEKVTGGQYVGEAGGSQEWSVSDPAIATVEEGVLVPLKNGEAVLTLKSGEQSTTAKIRVNKFDEASPV